mgnify:CR=1 FL=1
MILILLLAIIVILNITKTENLSEFKIMSDEIVNVKYSNRNAPSLIFNSFVSIFNINKAPLHNKKTNYF